MWKGSDMLPLTIHASSGTMQKPSYFYRNLLSDVRRELILEDFFKYRTKKNNQHSTLFVIALGMGVWSAGVGTYTGAYLASTSNSYNLSIISPGSNKVEIAKILKKIAPAYDEVVIAAYPPIAKDVIDEALEEGIDLQKINLRFIFTGEPFSEKFRDYLARYGKIRNPLIDTMNTYGTSELGTVAVETPLTILIRQLVGERFSDIFGDVNGKIPTLAQYNPLFVNFDCKSGELYFTGDNAIPLFRHEAGDNGGIYSYEDTLDLLGKHGIDLEKASKEAGISKFVSKLPLVYVYERKNLVTSLSGALIYPEYVRSPLLDSDFHDFVTGKFTMLQKYDSDQNQYLEINVELRRKVRPSKRLEESLERHIVDSMKKRSSEFAYVYKMRGHSARPVVILWPYEDPKYFKSKGKQRWIAKDN
jgi:phenylacetate-CoA ligase